MATKRSQSDTNKASAENSVLVAYRLQAVETALNILTTRFDNQDNIKKADLIEFRDTIVSRINDVKLNLQDQISDLKANKANKQEFRDFKKQMAGIGAVALALLVATYSFILTRLH